MTKTSWARAAVIQLVLFIHLILPIGSSHSPSHRVDLCSSCRGGNSTCRVVAGIFTRPQLSVGYHLVAHIPRGSCNLNISEIRSSPNHLALRRKNGTYIFNGDWRLSYSGDYSSAGTVYTYSRQDLKTLESVTSPGPIHESLDLMVLYQLPNPGIKYEYMLPSSLDSRELPPVVPLLAQQDSLLSPRSSRDFHHFRQATPATSRPYQHTNHQFSSGNYRGSRADSSLSSPSSSLLQRPQQDYHHSSPFNSLSAFPLNTNGNSNNNGKQNGGGVLPDFGGAPTSGGGAFLYNNNNGPDILSVYAKGNNNNNGAGHANGNNGANIIANSHHNHHHLHSHRRRNHKSSSSSAQSSSAEKKFYWKITGFTNCTEPCGGGMQRSIVRCVRGTATTTASTGNANAAVVSDRRCSSEDKPAAQVIRCNLKPCPAEWVIGDWSPCTSVNAQDSDCGDAFKTRSVHCQQRISPTLTMRVAEGACLQQRPESRVSCQLRPCNHWRASEWSQCSAHCGNGVRKRSVFCVAAQPSRVIGAEECDQAEKPAELTPCNMGPCEGVDWFASEWSNECSQQCGNGIQTRHVVCSVLHPQQSQQPSQYYSYEHPQYQNVSRRASSSELETNIIEGTQSPGEMQLETPISSPATTSYQFQESPQLLSCEDSKKPTEERECFSEQTCAEPVWFTGDWSGCTATCGNGVKTRQVVCVMFSRGRFKIVQDDHCPSEDKPRNKETCQGADECPHRWFTTEWSECSALCGGGIQKRSVSCRHSANWTATSSLCADKDRPVERKSCNEQKCTLTPVIPTASNYTRPIQQDYGPTSEPPTVAPSLHHHRHHKTTVQPTTSSPIIAEDDKEDADCSDQYRNCALVVQARLCRYKYYRSVCCQSCSDAAVF